MSPADSDILLAADQVHRCFVSGGRFARRHVVHALQGVSVEVVRGETLGIVGESGCGKSTLARMLLRLDRPDRGDVRFRQRSIFRLSGSALNEFRQRVQIVFQDPQASLNPRHRIGTIIGEPLRVHRRCRGAQCDQRVAELLTMVGMQPDQARRYPHEFSSGQRQRIGIARALSLEPALIVADEPVSSLDVSIQAQILNLFKQLQRQLGLTYVFISHDLSVVRYLADRVVVMYGGTVVEEAPADQLFAAPLHPYTRSLLAAVPVADPTAPAPRQADICDAPVDPLRGCVYAARCAHARPECRRHRPALAPRSPGRRVACPQR